MLYILLFFKLLLEHFSPGSYLWNSCFIGIITKSNNQATEIWIVEVYQRIWLLKSLLYWKKCSCPNCSLTDSLSGGSVYPLPSDIWHHTFSYITFGLSGGQKHTSLHHRRVYKCSLCFRNNSPYLVCFGPLWWNIPQVILLSTGPSSGRFWNCYSLNKK